MDTMTYEKFKNQWLKHFAALLNNNPRVKSLIRAEQYIWHLFSWGYLPKECFLMGVDAVQAFDSLTPEEKESAIYFERFGRYLPSLPYRKNICAEDLTECTEIYVVARDFSWTYIWTHEGTLCGPYYCDRELLSNYRLEGESK